MRGLVWKLLREPSRKFDCLKPLNAQTDYQLGGGGGGILERMEVGLLKINEGVSIGQGLFEITTWKAIHQKT